MSVRVDHTALRRAWRQLKAAKITRLDELQVVAQTDQLSLSTPRATVTVASSGGTEFTVAISAHRFGRLLEHADSPLQLDAHGGDLIVRAGLGQFRFYAPEHRGWDAAQAWRQQRAEGVAPAPEAHP